LRRGPKPGDRLRDLHRGAWEDRHRDLLGLDELDLGYRLIVGRPGVARQE